MTFEEYWGEDPDPGKITAKHAWTAGQKAEHEKCAKLIEAAEAAVNSCWRLDTDISEEIAELRDLLERMKNDS